jgi:hypothetical protein
LLNSRFSLRMASILSTRIVGFLLLSHVYTVLYPQRSLYCNWICHVPITDLSLFPIFLHVAQRFVDKRECFVADIEVPSKAFSNGISQGTSIRRGHSRQIQANSVDVCTSARVVAGDYITPHPSISRGKGYKRRSRITDSVKGSQLPTGLSEHNTCSEQWHGNPQTDGDEDPRFHLR